MIIFSSCCKSMGFLLPLLSMFMYMINISWPSSRLHLQFNYAQIADAREKSRLSIAGDPHTGLPVNLVLLFHNRRTFHFPSQIASGCQVTSCTGKTHGLRVFDVQVIFFQYITCHFCELKQSLSAWADCINLPHAIW